MNKKTFELEYENVQNQKFSAYAFSCFKSDATSIMVMRCKLFL